MMFVMYEVQDVELIGEIMMLTLNFKDGYGNIQPFRLRKSTVDWIMECRSNFHSGKEGSDIARIESIQGKKHRLTYTLKNYDGFILLEISSWGHDGNVWEFIKTTEFKLDEELLDEISKKIDETIKQSQMLG